MWENTGKEKHTHPEGLLQPPHPGPFTPLRLPPCLVPNISSGSAELPLSDRHITATLQCDPVHWPGCQLKAPAASHSAPQGDIAFLLTHTPHHISKDTLYYCLPQTSQTAALLLPTTPPPLPLLLAEASLSPFSPPLHSPAFYLPETFWFDLTCNKLPEVTETSSARAHWHWQAQQKETAGSFAGADQ